MGLVKAVQEFNPYKDVRLTTYAVWWIRSYIQDSILKNFSLVKLGTTQAQKRLFYRLRAEQKKLEQMGLVPQQSVKLLASRLDVREKDITEMDQRLSQSDLSLNNPMSVDDKKEHLQNLADPRESADETLGDAEQRELFRKILGQFADTLEGREKVVFAERLISETPLTLQEIGDKYGVTKERARQIEEHIKKKLREYMQAHYPDYKILTEGM
jgi:RNA polymerase sigma-32 factor